MLVDVMQQFDVVAEFHAEILEQLGDRIEIEFFVESTAGEPAVRTAAFPRGDHAAATVSAHLRAHVPVSFVHVFPDVLGHFFAVAPVGMRVERNRITHLATDQLVYGHAGALAFDVPQRHIECTECVVLNRTVAPIGADVRTLPEILDTIGVFAEPKRCVLLLDRCHHRGCVVHITRGTDAVEPRFTGNDFEEHPLIVVRGAGGDRLDFGDF